MPLAFDFLDAADLAAVLLALKVVELRLWFPFEPDFIDQNTRCESNYVCVFHVIALIKTDNEILFAHHINSLSIKFSLLETGEFSFISQNKKALDEWDSVE